MSAVRIANGDVTPRGNQVSSKSEVVGFQTSVTPGSSSKPIRPKNVPPRSLHWPIRQVRPYRRTDVPATSELSRSPMGSGVLVARTTANATGPFRPSSPLGEVIDMSRQNRTFSACRTEDRGQREVSIDCVTAARQVLRVQTSASLGTRLTSHRQHTRPSASNDYYVESQIAGGLRGIREQPSLCGASKPMLFLRADHFEGIAEAIAALRLDLAEDDGAAATDHEVELVPARPDIRRQDPVAAQPVMPQRPALGLRAD